MPVTCLVRRDRAPAYRESTVQGRASHTVACFLCCSGFQAKPCMAFGPQLYGPGSLAWPQRSGFVWFWQAPVDLCTALLGNKQYRANMYDLSCWTRSSRRAAIVSVSSIAVFPVPGMATSLCWVLSRCMCIKTAWRMGGLELLCAETVALVLEPKQSRCQQQALERVSWGLCVTEQGMSKMVLSSWSRWKLELLRGRGKRETR